MVEMLAVQNNQFSQIVAVDRNFVIFNRAWCVAELSLAHEVGMRQRLLIFAEEMIAEHEERLRSLRIQDMKASRPQDIDVILAKIPDVDAFNSTLQALLFDDLFPTWWGHDALEQ